MNWLSKKDSKIVISQRGKHQYAIEYPYWSQPYIIPWKHNEVNKYIVKDLMEQLVNSDICTKEEFDQYIR
ncbi:MAG: hypothetical protein UT42_C0043G0005 [Candidatus Falkowbacteria bacterium GW2011_GWA2_39_24]|uniref:YcfA family protein n=1 Tax=Candidatus Falkowbacteria bacterium GW2011_GWA2_39_24 TaxID=1618634 RepID=A0A0G0NBX3_9BACT|nr:MAG: hypothetical protein UT42_C0043G0005 [Candidatus Falkowbacteria bacterium GW2011_GWA2_39_24]